MSMRTTLALALAVTAVAGCKKKDKDKPAETGSATTTTTKPTEGSGSAAATKPAPLTGEALGKKYVECTGLVNDGKFDDFKSGCLATSYTGHDMDGEDMTSPDQVIGFFKTMKTAMPDFKLLPQLVLVNGRNVLAVTLMSGKQTGPLAIPGMEEMKPSGKQVGVLFFHRLALDDENKATEEWTYSDPATLMSQLGAMGPDGPPARAAMTEGMAGAPMIVVAADDAKEQANLEIAKKSDEAFNKHDVPGLLALMTDDAVESDQADPADVKGKAAMQKGLEMFVTAFPDVKIEPTTTFAAGDYVVELGTLTGTNKGPMGPMKATNKPIKSSYAEIMKIQDGKIATLWRFRNGMVTATQLGLMGPPAGGADDNGGK